MLYRLQINNFINRPYTNTFFFLCENDTFDFNDLTFTNIAAIDSVSENYNKVPCYVVIDVVYFNSNGKLDR